VEDPGDQAYETVREIQRLQRLESGFSFAGCAVLAREWQDLDGVRFLLEKATIPVSINWARYNFPSFSRIRENENILSFLQNIKTEKISPSELLHLLPEKQTHDNPWQSNLRGLIDDWLEESGNRSTPVPELLDYFYEILADQSRSGNLGNGVFLSTVHSVKGMEFNHVFILADNWHNKQKTILEEERRLFYVAMSRARETLHIFSPWPDEHPHSRVLTDDDIVFRKRIPHNKSQETIFHYEILAMKELFLDYAGQKPPSHPIHGALRRLTTGDKLQLVNNNDRLELTSEGVVVARLAKTVSKRLTNELHNIKQIKIIALIKRTRNDISDEKFASLCRVDSWEIPIVELWKTIE
jgi:ATP-dependent DNA helicase RecQ